MTGGGVQDFNNLFGEGASQLAGAPSLKSGKVRPKYTQIRDDQWAELDELARELMDARSEKGRRITSNSLIRVAIDALLAQREQLGGDHEDAIRVNYLKTLGVPEDKIS
ncbi:hypothetical protein [Streptomyces sp. NPDC047525]|uniref:hypothetical protein n=1 Tax=Streptomyces sp. NPDC047525 TaxID=3155264 RepID=UPI0033CF7632